MIRQSLHDNWFVSTVSGEGIPAMIRGQRIPASVPGCVHTDLLRAGLIEDPYIDRNEAKQRWVGEADWVYEATFDADAKLLDQERVDLVFDGLDTVAEIELNGQVIGEAFNMHHPHRFDVRRVIRPRSNALRVTFHSPNAHVRDWEKKLGPLPYMNTPLPFNFIRKMACSFGWDWGPTTSTSGIWREVRLEGWKDVRITSCRPSVMLISDQKRAKLDVQVELEQSEEFEWGDEGPRASAELIGPGGERVTSPAVQRGPERLSFHFDIESPALWWPRGHGEQPLYRLKVSTGDDAWTGRIGLRTVELDTSPDEIGSRFVVKVNGKPIFCRGANWIPDDCFLDRCTPGRYRRRIQQAIDANMNMLRVWGGGIYETEDFYDICDELGVMVWQDFLFACAAYPEEEPFRASVEREARYNVARLSGHPSLVLWNGCNENLWGYHDWGWKAKGLVKDRTWGPGYYLDLLPKVCREVDPSRPYWAGSPWSGDPDYENGLHPNLATHGNKHVWEAWHGGTYDAYHRFEPRFCSEFGFQGPPTYATLARAIPPQQRHRGSESLEVHQKSPDGNARNERHLQHHFDLPEDFDDLHYLLQLNQARALTLGVEWFRSRQPVCMGTLYWQLNDCWPVTSWAAIDGDGRLKPLWYATRRFYSDRICTIQPKGENYQPGDALWLFAINDSDEPGAGRTRVTRRRFDGTVLAEQEVEIEWAPRSNQPISLDPRIITPDDPSAELITVGSPASATWFFLADKHLRYPAPRFEAALQRQGDEHRLTITAQSLLRDVCVFADRLDPQATVNDQLITLLPGDGFTFVIRSEQKLDQAPLTRPPVLQCANRFGKR